MAIPETIKRLSNDVRNKIYGKDVRESIAKGMEESGDIADNALDTSNQTKARQDDVENRFDDQMAGNTDIDEVVDARRPRFGEAFPTLGRRLDDEHDGVMTILDHHSLEIGDKSPLPEWLTESLRQVTQLHDDDLRQRGINVKMPPYNARGNGVDDDTSIIQSALDDLEDGGTLIIPPGSRFLIDNLTINRDDVTIIGYGKSSIIRQSKNAADAPIINAEGQNFIAKDFRIEGDWEVVKENSHGIYGLNNFEVYGVTFEDINGDAIYNNGRAIINGVNIRHTMGDGIHVGADSIINAVNIGRTGKYGIDLAGSHNSVSGVMLWMCGNNTRTKNTNYGGMRIAARLNSVVGFTVIASAGHGVEVGGRGHIITGTTTNNGLMEAFDNNKAGLWGRNLESCVINISASNSVDKPSNGNGSWGWQRYGVEIENFNSNLGNIINVTANDVDEVIKSDQRINPVNQLRKKNTINAPQVESLIFNEMPSPGENYLGQIILKKNTATEDQAFICIQRASGQYAWRQVTDIYS